MILRHRLAKQRKRLWSLFFVTALVSPFVFFSSKMRPLEQKGSGLVLLGQEALYTVQYAFFRTVDFLHSSWENYFHLVGVSQENSHLRKDIIWLKARMLDYEHQVTESSRLRKLLNFSEIYKKNLIIAEIVGQIGHFPFQTLRISRGKKHGLKVGMPVIAADGVVGRILRAGYLFSDVQLLSDTNFHLDVIVERTRVRGVLNGVTENRCRLQLPQRTDLRIGDTIITSGVTGSFPKGLPVGIVTRISYESDNISQLISIKPWVDSQSLEEVMIIAQVSAELETIEETAGSAWMSIKE
ncbi:MAG: rod shape-determining protein MreC [Oligoflexales bacterium]|nr:rod shape-determining protein MreC [Oligoflexales bacterium]